MSVTADARPPTALPLQVEEFYVITWTAKKEVIFEMPVRIPDPKRAPACAFGCPDAQRTRAPQHATESSNALPTALLGAREALHTRVATTPQPLTRPLRCFTQTGGAAFMREGPNLLKLARKEQCMALLTQLRTQFKLDGRIYRVYPSGEVQYLHPKDGVYPEKVNKGRTGANQNMRSIGKNANPAEARAPRPAGRLGERRGSYLRKRAAAALAAASLTRRSATPAQIKFSGVTPFDAK